VDQRLATLRTALVALRINQNEPELRLVHQLLDDWNGIGMIAVGMRRQGMWLSLTHVADGEWWCVFMGDNPMLARSPPCPHSPRRTAQVPGMP
jgi:hypothetical protein